MSNFQRARSDEQKAQRMDEIKKVASSLFKKHPYHEITLSTIGEGLGWSRANMYKYVTSKEEIFLQLAADARDAYFSALVGAFKGKNNFTKQEVSKKWASVANNNRGWAIYGSILISIIETNVTLERLKQFKREYYNWVDVLTEKVAPKIGVPTSSFQAFLNTIHYHEVGLSGFCTMNPLAKQAIKELGVARASLDFETEMQKFVLMCLEGYRCKQIVQSQHQTQTT